LILFQAWPFLILKQSFGDMVSCSSHRTTCSHSFLFNVNSDRQKHFWKKYTGFSFSKFPRSKTKIINGFFGVLELQWLQQHNARWPACNNVWFPINIISTAKCFQSCRRPPTNHQPWNQWRKKSRQQPLASAAPTARVLVQRFPFALEWMTQTYATPSDCRATNGKGWECINWTMLSRLVFFAQNFRVWVTLALKSWIYDFNVFLNWWGYKNVNATGALRTWSFIYIVSE